ncbi:putative ribosomal protein L7Ae/L30e/S12e/Gadd4 [Paratrimastix pyriformis]|uniref:H/ACA ribonucleoprotein complex subunit 2 n=1 Tax=Paratrimastix pyriformis TaxID=342808 RepID=A0ABQ8UZV7_9EUKA|nr:putative ribosomal protein L7Ae/L30e/S12e/Gadd4 [Paratrimastix pyriformis]
MGKIAVIANPLAGEKLTKKLLKVVTKTAKDKLLRRGVKEVVKSIRTGKKGLCIIAGDISPIDVVSHIPVFCEENEIPYVYVPSKAELGAASATKRPTSCTLVLPPPEDAAHQKLRAKYEKLVAHVKTMTPSL